eukprot:CAMPEP_0185597502 /NCGR_PEP_ID=MMETSP0434-20130131/81406_1 /TAXON_ID=626734 ORGANISM="Favella taraikaensis, Strain Fe Narragansett Bay" /NCGR_SAMPLE_ID=MMETSP0434 /ASSEMBLY_ACC=CAM_ASM_000379 /LENGTH=59 /DNA_ID=CAMNT_0028226243 /DNA_START=1262 /DNA_END=1441 /DNA_ORIENTATION=+
MEAVDGNDDLAGADKEHARNVDEEEFERGDQHSRSHGSPEISLLHADSFHLKEHADDDV